MPTQDILQIFSDNCILGKADVKNIQRYLPDSALLLREFAGGDIIFSPDNQEKCVGILLSGTANVMPASGADNAMLKILCVGEMFGIANLYSENLPFPSIITARTACKVLIIGGDAFTELIENDTNALRAYLSVLNNKIAYLNKKISTLTAPTTEKKLALYLAENECNGNLSMSALADILGVGRASLYRAIDTLTDLGLIVKNGKQISIPDKIALLNF